MFEERQEAGDELDAFPQRHEPLEVVAVVVLEAQTHEQAVHRLAPVLVHRAAATTTRHQCRRNYRNNATYLAI